MRCKSYKKNTVKEKMPKTMGKMRCKSYKENTMKEKKKNEVEKYK